MKNIEVYLSGFFLLVGIVICGQSLTMPLHGEYGPGPGLLPLWIAGIMTVLSAINIFKSFKRNDTQFADFLPKGTGLINLLSCIGSFTLFMLIVDYAGFVASSILMLFILFSRGYKWYWGLGMSILVTGIMFYIFGSVLTVPLPVNEFGW